MTEPLWLIREQIFLLHDDQLAEFGGMPGVLKPEAIDSCLARPRNLYAYAGSEVDVFRLSACYSYGFARNHCFIDGNKRVAVIAAFTFLWENGFVLPSTPAVEALYSRRWRAAK